MKRVRLLETENDDCAAAARSEITSIDAALTDPHLLGAALGDPASWSRWLIVLAAAYGLPLNDEQHQQFAEVAGNRNPPSGRVRELWAILSRRSGKSRMAAALAVYAAVFQKHKLASGEQGMVLVLAASQAQARTVFLYALGFLQESPVLRQELLDATRSEIRLRNGVVIAIHANSFRSIRGRTLLAAVLDECAFWRSEDSAQPDTETYTALLPSLATTNGVLVGISTPYRKLGLLHQKHRDHFGQDDPDVLVVQGTAAQFNPTLSESTIAAQRAADPQGAISEWDAEFRSDISAFLDDALIEASINHGRPLELPPQRGITYKAFVDASAGRGDAYTVAIGHRDKGRLIIDAVRGQHVPFGAHTFDPMAATKQFADLVKQYHVGTVVGDNYAGSWVSEAWRKHLIAYIKSELTKSEIYLECLPRFTRGLVSLPDHPRLLKELRLLERRVHRSGKDSVDHGRSGHDDYSNAVCGCLRSLAFATWDAWDAAYGDGGTSPASRSHSSTLRRKLGSIGNRWASRSTQQVGGGGHDQTHTTQALLQLANAGESTMSNTLEQRITAALTNKTLTSGELAKLIEQLEAAVAQSEQAAEAERAKSLDPLRSPDPAVARQAMEDARFAADRLRTLLPKLQAQCRQVAARETYEEWAAKFEALIPRHTTATEKLRAIYTAFQDKLVDALTEAKQVDAEVRRVANAKPHHLPQANGDRRSLPTVEAAARGLKGVSPDFSLMTMKLPAFDAPNALVWPPYEVPLAVQVAASMVPVATDPRQYTGEWWKIQRERAQAIREQQQREQQERQAEADANYHGPRWLERTAS